MQLDIVNNVKSTLVPDGHPFMTGVFTPNHVECNAGDLTVIGKIPEALNGVYLRNTQTSECVGLDAGNIAAGPVARMMLPHPISSGTHSCWADASEIRSDWAGF